MLASAIRIRRETGSLVLKLPVIYYICTKKFRMRNRLPMDESDEFRQSYKYFKQRNSAEVLKNVIDFESKNLHEFIVPANNNLLKTNPFPETCSSCLKLGLSLHHTWHVYSLKNINGFFYIKNPFTVEGQQIWIKKCLELYSKKPSVTNLDRHYKCLDDIWSLQNDIDPAKRNLVNKLTWATLGYHYNWDTKEYDPSHHSAFPECLGALSNHVAACLGLKTFAPDAAIVNYYNLKSTLGIHSDYSEKVLNEPIVSISFGQSAIFLIGTAVKTDKPVPIFLRSGDIILLSGESRLAYHAVPAIFEDKVEDRFCISNLENNAWKPYHDYIKNHRINISVRQVYRS